MVVIREISHVGFMLPFATPVPILLSVSFSVNENHITYGDFYEILFLKNWKCLTDLKLLQYGWEVSRH